MTKLTKNSTRFPEYSVAELLEMAEGLTALFGSLLFSEGASYFGDKDKDNISRLISLEKEMLIEVYNRIPFKVLEYSPKEREERGIE